MQRHSHGTLQEFYRSRVWEKNLYQKHYETLKHCNNAMVLQRLRKTKKLKWIIQ